MQALQSLWQRLRKNGGGAGGRPSLLGRLLGRTGPPEHEAGIYIWGDVGRGKTLLMDLFVESWGEAMSCRRIHFHAFMQRVHRQIHAWRQSKYRQSQDPIEPVARRLMEDGWLWCLDELQIHDVADAMIIGRLVKAMLRRGAVFVITSNRPPQELYQGGLQREQFQGFIDLVLARMPVHELAGRQDYRLQQLQALECTYYTPLGEGAAQFMQNAWDRMTHGQACYAQELSVSGRILKLGRVCGDILWTSFEDLCIRPLGPADYLAIAEEFHTVLLEDIPALPTEQRNEAKRFVTLIDALYDHHVKLICTADAQPEEIYTKGHGYFEFQRTASRLHEMQSAAYLKSTHR